MARSRSELLTVIGEIDARLDFDLLVDDLSAEEKAELKEERRCAYKELNELNG